MKKKHLKNVMSLSLTTVTTDDGITVESNDVTNNNATDDGIVVNDDGIEITTAIYIYH